MKATVIKIVKQGKHGPYAVAKSDEFDGSITFALRKEVWQESDYPEPGSQVYLTDIRKKVKGWRAVNVRYLRLNDEQKVKQEHPTIYTKSKKEGKNRYE